MPHIHERIDFVADVFIVHDNKVLLRKHDKYKIWLSPGGHIELDEDPNQAAIREVKEEVGLDITLAGETRTFAKSVEGKDLLPPRFLNRHTVKEGHEHISMVYFATTRTTDITQGSTEISDDIRWFTREELDDPKSGVNDRIRFYAKKALEALAS
jgi:8-oxo-dGTP pyrophosphatase MutT (NUDIX family)